VAKVETCLLNQQEHDELAAISAPACQLGSAALEFSLDVVVFYVPAGDDATAVAAPVARTGFGARPMLARRFHCTDVQARRAATACTFGGAGARGEWAY
jgi:hypothetical protein